MSTIVLHKPTNRKYILIGTGYEKQNKVDNMEPLYGSLHRSKIGQAMEMAALCDSSGQIRFFPSDELVVLEIDGVSPAQIII